ncbi:MAG: cyclase family protein [Ectothiorhodospiraceae bacterium]|nr:cyclase family protein [Ectothiorhodospiraceae bacterium]
MADDPAVHFPPAPGDQIGAGGGQTNASRLAALSLIREGRLFELDHPIKAGAPFWERIQPPFLMSFWSTADRVIRAVRGQGVRNDPGVNLEHVHMTFHVGTHVDALGHFSVGDRMYGGHSAAEIVGNQGLRRLGVEHVPSLITRGICIDVAGLDGGDHLEAGRAVSADDLQQTLNQQEITIQPGDTVLIRTGWSRHYMRDNARYTAGEPGIDLDAAQWLTGQGVYAIGSDNMAVEVLPGVDREVSMPVHQHALVDRGVYLIENLALDGLTASVTTPFCFIMLPARFAGATGSPVRPIALI